MADIKISGLPAVVGALAGTEVFEVVQSSTSKKVAASVIAATFSTDPANILPARAGGTGQSVYAVGDLLYASTTTALSKLADVATGNALLSGGVGVVPAWGKIGLTTHVSGTLPVASGGTGAATLTGYVKGTGTAALTAAATVPVADISGTLTVAQGGTGRAVGNYSIYANEIHVSNLSGNDTTGDGTLVNPVATVTKALTLLTATCRTVIMHPGVYAESPTVSAANTTITTLELTGANTHLTGTLTVSAAARISGLKISNLTITGTGSIYISNCTVDTQVIKSGSNYVEIINSELQCVSGVQITGAGTVSIVGNKCWAVASSNAGANVIIKDCFQVITPSVTAGSMSFDGCVILAAAPASNAITASGGSFITLANSFVLNSAGTSVERVSLAGSYSILNLVYDKTNSALAGTNLNAIDYFSVINADTLVLTNDLTVANGGTGASTLTSGYLVKGNGTSAVTASVIYDDGANVGVGTATPNASAILDVQSTTKGFRLPNMTTAQKNAIASPAAGLMIFDTSLAKACVYTGSAWQTITSA